MPWARSRRVVEALLRAPKRRVFSEWNGQRACFAPAFVRAPASHHLRCLREDKASMKSGNEPTHGEGLPLLRGCVTA